MDAQAASICNLIIGLRSPCSLSNIPTVHTQMVTGNCFNAVKQNKVSNPHRIREKFENLDWQGKKKRNQEILLFKSSVVLRDYLKLWLLLLKQAENIK